MHLETLPHFSLGATLVRQPLCEPFACVRGENEDGNFDVRGSADVKHNVYSESWSFLGQHTHSSSNTHFGQERSDLFLFVLFTFDDTRWDIWVCVSWRNVSHAHSLFHGLRNPLDTDHVRMSFFTPFHVVQPQFPPNFFRLPNHLFSLSCCPYICLRSSLLTKMRFTDVDSTLMHSLFECGSTRISTKISMV